jgi:DNA polymerase III alpha subunit (gram-positive type)
MIEIPIIRSFAAHYCCMQCKELATEDNYSLSKGAHYVCAECQWKYKARDGQVVEWSNYAR